MKCLVTLEIDDHEFTEQELNDYLLEKLGDIPKIKLFVKKVQQIKFLKTKEYCTTVFDNHGNSYGNGINYPAQKGEVLDIEDVVDLVDDLEGWVDLTFPESDFIEKPFWITVPKNEIEIID